MIFSLNRALYLIGIVLTILSIIGNIILLYNGHPD